MDEIYRKLDTLQASTSLLADTYNSDVQITESGHALFGKEVRTPIINGLGTTLTTKVNDTTIAVASSSQIDFQGIDLVNINNLQASSVVNVVPSNSVVVSINNTNSPYTLTTATDILICTASAGSITIVLPTAVDNSGKILRLIRTDTTLSYNVSLTTVLGQTIGGLTIRRMWTANESWNIVSNGANWHVLSHDATTKWSSSEAITITGTTSNPSKGTGGTDKNLWRRDGDIAEINMRYSPGTGSTDGSGDYVYRIPAGLTMDTSIIQTYTTVEGPGVYALGHGVIGYGAIVGGSSDVGVVCCIAYSSTQYRLASFTTGTTPGGYIASGYFGNSSSVIQINTTLRVPITNWDA